MSPPLFRFAALLQIISFPAFLELSAVQVLATPTVPLQGWTAPPPVLTSKRVKRNQKTPSPPSFSKRLKETPTVKELRGSRLLDSPMVRHSSPAMKEANRSDTARVLEAYADRATLPASERLKPLVDHLQSKPSSDLSASLWLELGKMSARTGYFSLALKALSTTWEQTCEEVTNNDVIDLAETALMELVNVQLRLGLRSELRSLMDKLSDRPPHVISSAIIARAKTQLV